MNYTLQHQITGDFEEAVERTIDALEEEGFGVLCDIDVQATLAKKLDIEYRNYRILGACNPQLAYQGLEEEVELGALLPCNVIVYETDDGEVMVSAVDPKQLVGLTGNSNLDAISEEVSDRFQRVLDAL